MLKQGRLLPTLRSKNYEWLLRAAYGGGAVVGAMIAAGAVLAASHGKHPRSPWEVALIVVVALAVLGVTALIAGGLGAFLTRPVSPAHAEAIKATAGALITSLGAEESSNYGGGYKPDQAFHVHFKRLGRALNAWDEVARAPGVADDALGERVDALMAERGITAANPDVIYNIPKIRRYALAVTAEHESGRLPDVATFQWGEATTATPAGEADIPGPPWGVRLPFSGEDWITLTPTPEESKEAWIARTVPFTQQVDSLMVAATTEARTEARTVLEAKRRLGDFRRDRAPAILDALRQIEVREAPRVRHGCESC